MAHALDSWHLYIDGKWCSGEGGPDRDVVNPATGAAFAKAPEACVAQAQEAVGAARRAQPAWGRRAPIERARTMRQIAALIRRDAETLVMPFDRFSDAVAISNRSRYGLSAYLFTKDLQRVMRAVRDIDFGEVYVNRIGPESFQGFHVGCRQSGGGGDDGLHGLELYLKKKTVYVNYSDGPTTGLMPYSGR